MAHTLRRGPTVQTEMSLATAGIHCTISQRLSGAMDSTSVFTLHCGSTVSDWFVFAPL